MTSRVFIILIAIAIGASVIAGLIVDRYTAPGMERTVGFGLIMALILFPIGYWMEQRGWIRGGVDLRKTLAPKKPAPPADAGAGPAPQPGSDGTADAAQITSQNPTKNETPARTPGGHS